MEIDRFIGTAELYKTLNIGHSKLYLLFASGALKPRKLGTKTGVLASELNAYLKSLPLLEMSSASEPPRAA